MIHGKTLLSGEISDLNAKLQEQGLVLAAIKNELRKLKGKALDKEAIETYSVDPKVSKDNVEPITPKFQRDKANARAMIQAIDKRLKTRRIMRSLERFVGGRPYGAGNPVKKILLKLNLSDHRSILTDLKTILKMVVEVPDSS
ncbi:hypothetical protein Tco_1021867 [Tanacetum coccineum]